MKPKMLSDFFTKKMELAQGCPIAYRFIDYVVSHCKFDEASLAAFVGDKHDPQFMQYMVEKGWALNEGDFWRRTDLMLDLFRIPKGRSALSPDAKKAIAEETSTPIWEAYRASHMRRYGFEPKRHARSNAVCKQIRDMYGLDEAITIVQAYVANNNAFYVKQAHRLGLLPSVVEAVVADIKGPMKLTRRNVDNLEKTAGSVNAAEQFLNWKQGHGS